MQLAKYSRWPPECFYLYWSIVAFQHCVSFCWTAKWVSHTQTYITPPFCEFLPIQATTEHWIEFPVLYSKFSLVIYVIHSEVYMSNPVSHFIPSPFPALMSIHLCLYFSFSNRFTWTIFLGCTYMLNIWYLFFSFWLASLCMTVSM